MENQCKFVEIGDQKHALNRRSTCNSSGNDGCFTLFLVFLVLLVTMLSYEDIKDLKSEVELLRRQVSSLTEQLGLEDYTFIGPSNFREDVVE